MINTVYGEVIIAITSFLLGVALAIIYDVFKAYRYGKYVSYSSIVLQDILYYVVAFTIIIAVLLRVNSLQLRLYIPVAMIVGGIVYRFTLSKFVVITIFRILSILKKSFTILFFPLKLIFKHLKSFLGVVRAKVFRKNMKFALTIKKFCFKIKCKAVLVCNKFKIDKEIKLCRKKQKPQ